MDRFRPNLVLDGLQPWDEDHIDELEIDTAEGLVRLKLVKPCARCTIPNVNPATGADGNEPRDTLAGFRADPRMDGALTFGMNAIVLPGVEHSLRPGQAARVKWACSEATPPKPRNSLLVASGRLAGAAGPLDAKCGSGCTRST